MPLNKEELINKNIRSPKNITKGAINKTKNKQK